MKCSDRAVFIALLCLSCASGPGPQRPSEPEPRPVCFTGTGAIDRPSPAAPTVRVAGQEAFGTAGVRVDGGTGSAKEGLVGTSGRVSGALIVIPGMPVFRGAVEMENLRRTVRGRARELATCRDASPAPAHQAIGGRVVVDFVIDPQGRVERSSVRSSTLDEPGIDACVGRQACRWTFAAPRDGSRAVVSYPLVLMPEYVP